nr:DUF539 domain-containing protein [Methylomarinovum sp. IN45]
MTLFLVTFAVIAVIVGIMAIGVMFGRPAIKGSCGGVGGGECLCAQGRKGCDAGLPEDAKKDQLET